MASENINSKKLEKLNYILYFAITLLVVALGFYFYNFNNGLSDDSSTWGTFGDFLGGTLNPIFALFSLFAIIYTIKIQTQELEFSREELKSTKEELEKSRIAQQEQSESLKLQNQAVKLQIFENTFFQLNEVFNNTKSGLSIKVDIFENQGGYINQGGEFTEYSGIDDADLHILDCIKTSIFKSNEVIEKYLIILKKRYKAFGYDEFNKKYEKFTGTYFAQIYQILKFIDDSNIENKQRYVNIFRAQFTKDELEFLFYHCLGTLGKRKFKKLAEDYEFFEHIILNPDIEKQLLEYDIKAFGKNESILNKYNELESQKS